MAMSVAFRLLGTLLEANPYLGRMVTGRVFAGSVKPNQQVKVLGADGVSFECSAACPCGAKATWRA